MADFSSLKKEIRGRIVEPSDGFKYDNEIKNAWNACVYDKRPLAFVRVKGKDDVAKTITFCVNNQVRYELMSKDIASTTRILCTVAIL